MRHFPSLAHAAAPLAAVAGLLAAAPAASAVGLTLGSSSSPGTQIIDLTGFMTTGADMGGQMTVTAVFPNATTETVPWLAGAGTAGSAIGTGWSLAESGDTFLTTPPDGLWTLDVTGPNTALDRLILTGVTPTAPGKGVQSTGIVFDRTVPEFGTGGSFRGRDFKIAGATGAYDLAVTYLDEIDNLADGPGPMRDVWGQLEIDFVPLVTGGGGVFGVADTLSFYQDTDLVGTRLDLPCTGPECPEPASALLIGGVAALGLRRARSR